MIFTQLTSISSLLFYIYPSYLPFYSFSIFTSIPFTYLPSFLLLFSFLSPFSSLLFTSLHFTSLHFTSLHFTSLHFTSLHFTSLFFPLLFTSYLPFYSTSLIFIFHSPPYFHYHTFLNLLLSPILFFIHGLPSSLPFLVHHLFFLIPSSSSVGIYFSTTKIK